MLLQQERDTRPEDHLHSPKNDSLPRNTMNEKRPKNLKRKK
jgi:hypothetical protein